MFLFLRDKEIGWLTKQENQTHWRGSLTPKFRMQNAPQFELFSTDKKKIPPLASCDKLKSEQARANEVVKVTDAKPEFEHRDPQ